jgi:choline kinase
LIVLPLAGHSLRFKEAGIESPKWSLKIGNQSILTRAIQSIIKSCNPHEEIVLGCLAHQINTLKVALNSELHRKVSIVTLNQTTNGQAETVFRIIEKIEADASERLVIWCGDSAFSSDAFSFALRDGNWMLVSKLSGDHWSFVREINGEVVEVTEKVRISDHASLGLYSFDSLQDFLETSPLEIRDGYRESFVAPLYNSLIKKRKKVEMFSIDPSDYYPLGTPKEIIQTAHRMKWELPLEFESFNL